MTRQLENKMWVLGDFGGRGYKHDATHTKRKDRKLMEVMTLALIINVRAVALVIPTSTVVDIYFRALTVSRFTLSRIYTENQWKMRNQCVGIDEYVGKYRS